MTTGNAQILSLPQDINSVVGKLLRMYLDGSISSDNPDPSSLVYSFGHRNAQHRICGLRQMRKSIVRNMVLERMTKSILSK